MAEITLAVIVIKCPDCQKEIEVPLKFDIEKFLDMLFKSLNKKPKQTKD